MSSVNVQITLSQLEYEKIKVNAAEKGLTPAQYIKQCAVDDTEFETRYDYLRQKALVNPEGQAFTVMSIFPDWNEIELGIRLSLGRTFYQLVKRGGLPPIIPAGKNSSNVQLYMVEENKMKRLLGGKYSSSNHVLNFLNYWIDPSTQELDKLWTRFNPDTIFSVWMPMKMCLQSSADYPYKKQGNEYYPYKDDNYVGKQGETINFLSDIINNIDIYLPHDKWQDLYKFAELAEKKANVMSLPNTKMQSRGEKFYDQMPPTLFNCFKGGVFGHYFYNDDDVVAWIKDQKLEVFFEDGKISKDSISPLIEGLKPNEHKWLTTESDIKKMLDRYVLILEERSKLLY